MKATTLASFQDTESTLKRYVRQSSSLRPRSDTAQTPLSFEELLSPAMFDDARGGAVSYRKSRASIFNDMSSEDLDRWMEKFDQAKLELRGMTDLYEEYGGYKKKWWFFAIMCFGTSMLVQPLAVVELRLGLLSFYTNG